MGTYWNKKGKYVRESDILWDLIPISGSVASPRGANKNLEKYRKACKVYYDLFNNGLGNRASAWSPIFGFPARVVKDHLKYYGFSSWDSHPLSNKIEEVMDKVIEDAWEEQMEIKLDCGTLMEKR